MEDRANVYDVLARGFDYPAPGALAALERGLASLPESPARRAFAAFIDRIGRLSLGQWEELCTRTLDLNPTAAPYVGYQTWGESYQRGAFLATMNRELARAGVDAGGELPDHLAPVLEYLSRVPDPLPELVEIIDPAIERIMRALRSADPEDPYLSLYQAVRLACERAGKETA